jgi:hypothetical protein
MTVPWGSTHLDRRPATVMEVAHDSLGLYVVPPVSHLELAARVPGYLPADLQELMESRSLIGLRCLRGSAFLMPVDLLPIVVPATREGNVKAFGTYLRRTLAEPYEIWAARIEDALAPGESLTKAQIIDRIAPSEADRRFMTNVISQMATESRLIGVRVPASWRSAHISYTRWSDWLPDVDVLSPDPDAARVALARLYLRSFGPASVEDFAWWSGLTKTQSRLAISGTDAAVVDNQFVIGPVNDESLSGVRLLPIWDTLFVTWKDRSRFIPDRLLPYVYDSFGNATSVVLIDGEVAGVWAMDQENDRLKLRIAPFREFTAAPLAMIEAEADAVRALAGVGSVQMQVVSSPPNLRDGKRNLFMTPV